MISPQHIRSNPCAVILCKDDVYDPLFDGGKGSGYWKISQMFTVSNFSFFPQKVPWQTVSGSGINKSGFRKRWINKACYPFCWIMIFSLKVLTNEKRGGLKVRAFDGSPFKLFMLRFSSKSVQAPSCEKPKTTQRTLFLSFEINNCFSITV